MKTMDYEKAYKKETDWITLRHQAAIAAMQGIIGNDIMRKTCYDLAEKHKITSQESFAATAVSFADALIESLKHLDAKEAENVFSPSSLDIKLEDSSLSVRAKNCLKSVDIRTIGDLLTWSRTDILKIRNIGKRTFNEIVDFLAAYGLQLGMKEE